MRRVFDLAKVSLGLFLLVFASFSWSAKEPVPLVEEMTDRVIGILNKYEQRTEAEEAQFQQEMLGTLSEVIAFDYIAVGVMGSYAKSADPSQRKRFSEIFQRDLVATYSNGVSSVGDVTTEILPDSGVIEQGNRTSVHQRFRGTDGSVVVTYTMGLSSVSGEWKVLNVLIDGVNLGATLRSQFAQTVKREGSLEKAIENWSAEEGRAELEESIEKSDGNPA